MSHGYKLVQWTPYKRRYDLTVAAGILIFLSLFFLVAKATWRGNRSISDEILLIRAFGFCAFLMLHFVLSIGPLARLDSRFLPLLYNRRHLGVMTFFVGLVHGALVVGFYHGFGVLNPVVSLISSNVQYSSWVAFPFESLGVIGLLILFIMAATSHDLWLSKLTPRVWKSLHMLVYVAWASLVMHVMLGALRAERSTVYPILILAGVIWIAGLHLLAGWREVRKDNTVSGDSGAWIDVGAIDDIPDSRAKTICLPGRERIAVFRYGKKVSAVSNVCAHQGGPLGEGKIVDGCITCPWHGFQYRPQDGCAPPPFTEKLPTYEVRMVGRRIQVNPVARPPGMHVEKEIIAEVVHV